MSPGRSVAKMTPSYQGVDMQLSESLGSTKIAKSQCGTAEKFSNPVAISVHVMGMSWELCAGPRRRLS